MKKIVVAIILAFVFVASVASAQLIYSSVRIAVEPGVSCPATWTASTSTVVTEEKFYIRVPVSLGGRIFLVSSDLVDALWPSAAQKAAAIVLGVLEHQAETSTTQSYCALLPTP